VLVVVPQGFVVLVFVGGKLQDVLEQPGVAFVARPAGELQLQFVDLRPQEGAAAAEPEELPDDWFV
jgi:regulator of protease activity HflC (stomatin/prohibitin superfamily)